MPDLQDRFAPYIGGEVEVTDSEGNILRAQIEDIMVCNGDVIIIGVTKRAEKVRDTWEERILEDFYVMMDNQGVTSEEGDAEIQFESVEGDVYTFFLPESEDLVFASSTSVH